jgi:hypothetical protein
MHSQHHKTFSLDPSSKRPCQTPFITLFILGRPQQFPISSQSV